MNRLLMEYYKKMQTAEDSDYIALLTIYHIAPTIAGLKPASLITFGKNGRELDKLWEIHKGNLKQAFEIDFYELKKTIDAVNVLFFYKDILNKVIIIKENKEYLKDFGYSENMNLDECLEHLKYRFEKECPHEIGLFLGIPLEDVKVFTEHPEKECLLRGYWKVYSNPQKAKIEFKKYDFVKEYLLKSIIE